MKKVTFDKNKEYLIDKLFELIEKYNDITKDFLNDREQILQNRDFTNLFEQEIPNKETQQAIKEVKNSSKK